MHAHLHMPAELRRGFTTAGFLDTGPGSPTVIAVDGMPEDWPGTLDSLTGVFLAAKAAAAAGQPVVFIVSADALLGRRGATAAMAAAGIVSGARTMAAEMVRAGVPVNCLATAADTPPETVARWAKQLLSGGPTDPTGELIQLGGVQIGKALS
jgi:NAD(P)-dependent dehydrogenase (short-subunit alcohol dehydrogenase family)